MINVFRDGDEWEVWHDVEDDPKNGVCIGTGDSELAALKDAKVELHQQLKLVQERIDAR